MVPLREELLAGAALALSKCCFSVLIPTVKLHCSISTRRLFSSLKGAAQRKHLRKLEPSFDKSNRQRAFLIGKEFPSRSSFKDGYKGKGDIKKPLFGLQWMKKMFSSKEHQVDQGNHIEEAFLDSVVKLYCTSTEPDFSLPWKKQRQSKSVGSAFVIGKGKLLTNAHCVEHETRVQVKRRGDSTKYVAKVLARGVDCDLALLSVESNEFWEGLETLSLGSLPHLQDSVIVAGYPIGGDTISVTRGVVSRIEVTPYSHVSFDLLGIQVDAAINSGNSGGPALNDEGECIGVAFEIMSFYVAENTGYLVPTTVISHFLDDYERNKKYTGFPCLGVLLQKLENPALRECLEVKSTEGLLVRRTEPTSDAHNVLKKGDVIVSFDDVPVGCEGTVPFQSNECIALGHLITQKFSGDVAELGIIRAGEFMKVKVVLNPRVRLVPYDIDEGRPSYLIIAGFVFTPLSEPLIESKSKGSFGRKLLAKARHSLPKFKGEQIVILSQVLAHEVNTGYEYMSNKQVLKLNGVRIKNIHHLAHLVDSCKDKYLTFEFEDNIAILEKEATTAASKSILQVHGIPSGRSIDLLEPFVDSLGDNEALDQDCGDCPVSNSDIDFDGLFWA